jgi:hypothetical protein
MIVALILRILLGAVCVGFAVQETHTPAVLGGELFSFIVSLAGLTLISRAVLDIAYYLGLVRACSGPVLKIPLTDATLFADRVFLLFFALRFRRG